MPKIFIPTIGTELTLTKDWDFSLIKDYRNKAIFDLYNVPYNDNAYYTRGQQFGRVILPAGTVLKVDRIYIRKGSPDYDSLSFYIVKSPVLQNKKGKCRFFAKLIDVNQIEYEGN